MFVWLDTQNIQTGSEFQLSVTQTTETRRKEFHDAKSKIWLNVILIVIA